MRTAAVVLLMAAACAADRMVLMGDSWGTEGKKAFYDMLLAKNSNIDAQDICVAGSTAKQWAKEKSLQKAAIAALNQSDVEVVWLTLMGNDIKNELPVCALTGGSTDHCIAKVVADVTPNMEFLFNFIHTYAPKARIVGFGYDIMGFGKDNGVCHDLPTVLLPHCLGNTTCFNSHFLTIQGVWDDLAPQYSYVDKLNMLGSIQAASGDTNATLGSPDLTTYSPAGYYESNCIHPNHKGFTVIFDIMYDMYLKQFEH
eukprot:TRINITY_DN2825_c0_g2_i1.p1 TRINITY_DN2825_c0_g2~~TRINITY_DN2825_c0_g2_i1.p1  ORF type:complete len:276 (+),score=114.20 TRINITY_DN2825_c0_g2_i1:61-828(+)